MCETLQPAITPTRWDVTAGLTKHTWSARSAPRIRRGLSGWHMWGDQPAVDPRLVPARAIHTDNIAGHTLTTARTPKRL